MYISVLRFVVSSECVVARSLELMYGMLLTFLLTILLTSRP